MGKRSWGTSSWPKQNYREEIVLEPMIDEAVI